MDWIAFILLSRFSSTTTIEASPFTKIHRIIQPLRYDHFQAANKHASSSSSLFNDGFAMLVSLFAHLNTICSGHPEPDDPVQKDILETIHNVVYLLRDSMLYQPSSIVTNLPRLIQLLLSDATKPWLLALHVLHGLSVLETSSTASTTHLQPIAQASLSTMCQQIEALLPEICSLLHQQSKSPQSVTPHMMTMACDLIQFDARFHNSNASSKANTHLLLDSGVVATLVKLQADLMTRWATSNHHTTLSPMDILCSRTFCLCLIYNREIMNFVTRVSQFMQMLGRTNFDEPSIRFSDPMAIQCSMLVLIVHIKGAMLSSMQVLALPTRALDTFTATTCVSIETVDALHVRTISTRSLSLFPSFSIFFKGVA
jgi:hypothetical protein